MNRRAKHLHRKAWYTLPVSTGRVHGPSRPVNTARGQARDGRCTLVPRYYVNRLIPFINFIASQNKSHFNLLYACFIIIMCVCFTGSIARSASRRYLIYSEADYEVFRTAGPTRCTDGVKFGF